MRQPKLSSLLTVKIIPSEGLAARREPRALSVQAFAAGLDHSRWLYVLPNGDVLVVETNAPPRPGCTFSAHIEGVSAQLRQLFPLFGRRSGQGFAGAVILWLYLQLIEQREGLLRQIANG